MTNVRGAAKLVFTKKAEPIAEPSAPAATTTMDDAPTTGALLSVRGLTHTYPGAARAALAPLDLDVTAGEIVAIAGGSGGGKTTLLNAVLGFLTPTGGRIYADGQPLNRLDGLASPRGLCRAVPRPGQRHVADNVRLGSPDASDDELQAALAAAGAAELPLDQPVGDNAEGCRRRATPDRHAALCCGSTMTADGS